MSEIKCLDDGTYDVTMVKGDSFSALITIMDDSGKPYELGEGDRIWFQMKENKNSRNLFFRTEVENDLILKIPTHVTNAVTPPKRFIFDIHISLAGGDRETFVRGTINVLPKVEGDYEDWTE